MANNSDYIPGVPKEDRLRASLSDSMDVVSFDTAKDYLRHTKVSSIFPSNRTKIEKVDDSTAVSEALQILIKKKILSMPVYDDRHSTWTSFIDMLDVVYHIVEQLKGADVSDAAFSQQLKTSENLSKVTVGYIAGLSGRNPFYAIEETAPLSIAMQLMADNKVQRIPVVSNSAREELATIITQSQVTNILNSIMDKFDFKDQTVASLSLGSNSVLSVERKQKAIEAFKLIHDKRVSGIAVVDNAKGGALYANISVSDIKHIGESAQHVSRLFGTVEQFLTFVCDNTTPTPISVKSTDTFRTVVSTMVEKKIHRIYIQDNGKPQGVISLTDIVTLVMKKL